MSGEWHVARDGQQYGPFTTEELRQQVVDGRLLPTDLLWKEDMPAWAPADTIKGFFPERAAAPPPIPAKGSPPVPPPMPTGVKSAPSAAQPPLSAEEYLVPLPAVLRKPLFPGMHNQRLLFLAGFALTFVFMIFPWYHESEEMIGDSSTEVGDVINQYREMLSSQLPEWETTIGFKLSPDGWVILLLMIPGCIFAFVHPNRTEPVTGGNLLGAAIPPALAAFYAGIDVVRYWGNDEATVGFVTMVVRTRPGFGLYFTFLITATVAAGAWLLVGRSQQRPNDEFWNARASDQSEIV